MDKNYYVEYYKLERSNWWFKARLEIIHSQVKKISEGRRDLRILNIGTATGATSEMLQEFGTVKSIEYDVDCYEFVKQTLSIDIEQGSILDLRFENNSFDLVCAFDVIEHVEDDKLAVSEMSRVCKPGGINMITVPAFMFLWGPHDVVNQHYRRYTLKQLKGLIKDQQLLFASYFNAVLFFPIALVRVMSKLIPFKRKGSGSDFGLVESDILNKLFYKIFVCEKGWLKRGWSFPCGVSVMSVSRKK